ncbi:MAG: MFS transporter [Desulfobacterales bacterium]
MPSAWALGAQYFAYFGVLGIYLPFFNLYCYHLEFSGAQIGLLSGVRSIMLVVFPLVWGAMADRFHRRRSIYILCNIASVLTWSLFLFTRDFTLMLVISALYGVFYAPIISFLEAFTMDTLGSRKRRYGTFRAWGSMAFILVVLILGRLLDRFSVEIVIPLILGGSAVHMLLAFKVPHGATGTGKMSAAGARDLFTRRSLIFLTAGVLMLFSHGTYYGFFSIHLEELGLERWFIGMSWAVAVTAEILVMVSSQRLFDRFSLESVITASFLFAALRWAILGLTANPLLILASQMLHAASYAAFHMASILYMDRLSPGSTKTLAQAVNNALSYGFGLMLGFLINGALYEGWNPFWLFRMSAAAALTGAVVFGIFGKPAAESP